MSVSPENTTLCNELTAYNRGSLLQTATVDACPFIDFVLTPSPAQFQPYVGFSLRIPPVISNVTFSYYGANVSSFTFTYSNVCDIVVGAANHTDITTPPACPMLNATSIKQVMQTLLTPAAAGLPDATFLNVVFLNVPADAVIYMGAVSFTTMAGVDITLGPCPTQSVFALAECTCNVCR